MRGKEKCKALKEIRKQIAEKNDIAYAVSECTHQGDCRGTCPKCEAELRYLERQLELRKNLGKAVAVAGISVGACTMMTACSPFDIIHDVISSIGSGNDDEISGAIDIQPPASESPQYIDIPGEVPEDMDILGGETTAPELEEELSGDIEILDTEEDPENYELDGLFEAPQEE